MVRFRLVTLLFVLLACVGHGVAQAATIETERVGVLYVDSDRILGEALVAKDIRAQIDRRRTELQGTFSRRSEKLHQEEEELIKQKGILSSDAFEAKVMEFRQSVDTMNRDVETKMAELEAMYSNAIGQVYEKIQQISKQVADSEGAAMVLFMTRGQVPFVVSSVDITEKILEILNKDLSRVSLGD
ncbi:OmpH family outer membrane protein [Candidatus Anaplasma sp. TIGMIC]|uniref:OmpH family outer membrane protein n=1 Tax=Candidatus Anaplasma sp. TIGMIC TaxID=3020713 RepID=UPI00233006E8|nr:OmpH family outer membrane protein [Candidatus Anaplasma sp. TIGMIC]MDB1135313.1 OmpH family outer membrane protein [Candidatus Anaplasma sp. TIGMIC]